MSADGFFVDGSTDGGVEIDRALPRDGGTGNGAGHFGDIDNDESPATEDCDDGNPDIYPGAPEICGNVIDDDCDGEIDEGCITGDVFYVDKDSVGGPCSDEGPGTIDQPWCTVAKANQALTPVQTVYVRAGTYLETIQPENSGASNSARITYSGYEDETVTFSESVYCVRLQGVSHITLRGLRFYNCERNLYISGGSDNHVTGCEFDTPQGPSTWGGSRIYDGSSYNRITHCVFSRYGAQGPNQQDSGVVLDIGSDNEVDHSDHNLIYGNDFSYGGHHILGVYSNYNVIRNNTFHNEEWYSCHRSDIGGLCGNRNVITNTSQPDKNIRNVFDRNHIVFSGVPPDQTTSTGLSLRTQKNIVRKNIFYYCDASGLALSNDGGNHNDASYNHIYRNVFYHNGYPLIEDWQVQRSGLLLARWVDDAQHNPMTGVAIKNNIFHDNQEYAVYYYYVDEQDQDVAGNWLEQGDPGFADISASPDPLDMNAFDFHLQSTSPCIDNGAFLTTITQSGQDTTTLHVGDAGYFFDGQGIVYGDYIQLEGQTDTVLVTHVDYENNDIDINVALTFAAHTGVALPYAGTRPDQGVYEHAQ
jgi:hypothetical protein